MSNSGKLIIFAAPSGAGKSSLIKKIIEISENKLELSEVTSPTFNILNEYQINQIKINHYDLFRLKSSEELKKSVC